MRKDYVFENGIVVGRFQHIHLGHEKLINIGLSVCKRMIIFIDGVDKTGVRNPFSYECRKELIEIIYKEEIEQGRIIVAPLENLEIITLPNPKWGKFVINSAKEIIGTTPDLIIYGKDKNIFKCFPKDIVKNISEIMVDRKQVEISATKIREYLKNNDIENWKKYTNSKIHFEYEKLRKILIHSLL